MRISERLLFSVFIFVCLLCFVFTVREIADIIERRGKAIHLLFKNPSAIVLLGLMTLSLSTRWQQQTYRICLSWGCFSICTK